MTKYNLSLMLLSLVLFYVLFPLLESTFVPLDVSKIYTYTHIANIRFLA